MEPMLAVEIQATSECSSVIHTILTRRRGHVLREMPNPATPMVTMHAQLPLIESFGFETDIRTHTQGHAFPQSIFSHYQIVPGDPLDKSVVLLPLEPTPSGQLARDFCIKTRRRKGLSENVSVVKYFDDDMLQEMAHSEHLARYGIKLE